MSSKSTTQQGQIKGMQELVNDFIHESIANLDRTEQSSDISACEMAETIIAYVQQFIAPEERIETDAHGTPSRAKPTHLPKPAPSAILLSSPSIRASVIANMLEVLPK
jgi:hypothetical protein